MYETSCQTWSEVDLGESGHGVPLSAVADVQEKSGHRPLPVAENARGQRRGAVARGPAPWHDCRRVIEAIAGRKAARFPARGLVSLSSGVLARSRPPQQRGVTKTRSGT